MRFGYVREPGQGFWIDGSSLQDMIGTLFGHAPHCCSAGLLGGLLSGLLSGLPSCIVHCEKSFFTAKYMFRCENVCFSSMHFHEGKMLSEAAQPAAH